MSRLLTRGTIGVASMLLALGLAVVPVSAHSPQQQPTSPYRVQRGDTLSGLANRFGTTITELVRLNGLRSADRIFTGRTLQIPRAAGGAAPTPTVASRHRVAPGETLSGLAARYRTSVDRLARLNGLADPNRIVVGMTLEIPADASAAAPSGARHVVAFGDTLSGIASRYGVSVADLVRWNGLTNGVLYATTSLVLYDPGPLPSSSIVCPVPGASFFNDWAFPRSGGRYHAGNDLFARRGTPVRAPVSGTVTVQEGPIGGLQVWLTDSAGNRWLGSHLDAFGATGSVRAGATIGYVGDTGNARGSSPHLHIEYHPAGRGPINPYPLLRQAC